MCQELIENVRERQVWGPDHQFGSLSKPIIKDHYNSNAMAAFHLKVTSLFFFFTDLSVVLLCYIFRLQRINKRLIFASLFMDLERIVIL